MLRRIFMSSLTEVFCKKGFLKDFAKITGKHLCRSLLFNKVAGSVYNFIKKETLAPVFPCEFCKNFKSTFLMQHPRWLPLKVSFCNVSYRQWLEICHDHQSFYFFEPLNNNNNNNNNDNKPNYMLHRSSRR